MKEIEFGYVAFPDGSGEDLFARWQKEYRGRSSVPLLEFCSRGTMHDRFVLMWRVGLGPVIVRTVATRVLEPFAKAHGGSEPALRLIQLLSQHQNKATEGELIQRELRSCPPSGKLNAAIHALVMATREVYPSRAWDLMDRAISYVSEGPSYPVTYDIQQAVFAYVEQEGYVVVAPDPVKMAVNAVWGSMPWRAEKGMHWTATVSDFLSAAVCVSGEEADKVRGHLIFLSASPPLHVQFQRDSVKECKDLVREMKESAQSRLRAVTRRVGGFCDCNTEEALEWGDP